MDNNNKDKVKNFFRKEGFYFVLFICLCVVATVVVINLNKNNSAKQVSDETKDFSLNIEEGQNSNGVSNNEIQNAERVENESSSEVANANEDESNEKNESADIENTEQLAPEEETYDETTDENVPTMAGVDNEIIFSLPLEGSVTREFGQMVEVSKSDNEQIIMTRRGVDIEAPVGTSVKCAADGTVEEVSSSTEEGNYVVVLHANGMKTKYANLDSQINVAVGDTVTAGQEIGKSGNSSLIFTSEICGEVVNIQVEDTQGNSVDPAEYFQF